MLHVPGMPEAVHVSFSPEHLPVSVPAPSTVIGAGTPSEGLTALLDAHEMAYGYALYTKAFGLPDVAERQRAEEEAFRALLHTPLQSDADRAAYAAAVISRQIHALGDGITGGRDHPLAVAYRNIRLGEHAREPEEMRHIGRPAVPVADPAADPILAAIEAHRAAHAAWYPLMCVWNDTAGGTPEYAAAEAADALARRVERGAFNALLNTPPTTIAGCLAFTAYVSGTVAENDHHLDEDTVRVLHALRDGSAAFRIEPATKAQPVREPQDLAQACIDMAERLDWLDQNENVSGFSETAWDAEFNRQGTVFQRAIDEPSADASDLAAKARLALSDFNRFKPADRFQGDGDRLMRVVLREAIMLAGKIGPDAQEAAGSEASGLDLSSYSIPQLCALFDVYERAEDQFQADAWWPKLGDAGSDLLVNESDRCIAIKTRWKRSFHDAPPGAGWMPTIVPRS